MEFISNYLFGIALKSVCVKCDYPRVWAGSTTPKLGFPMNGEASGWPKPNIDDFVPPNEHHSSSTQYKLNGVTHDSGRRGVSGCCCGLRR